MPPKRTVCYRQREWQQAHFLGKSLPCTFWGCGNRTAMALLLTTDEQAKLSKLLLVRRSIGNAKWRSNDTRKRKRTLMRPSHSGDGRRGTALIASKNRQSRQRRPSAESLCFEVRTINIVMTLAMMGMALRGHREHVGNGDCYGGNFLVLVAMEARFDTILQDLGP